MKIPETFMTDTVEKGGEGNTLFSLSDWILKNNPNKIEMSERQFWQFTYLQPLPPADEKYWTTYHGIPIICPEMTWEQQTNLGFKEIVVIRSV